MKSESSKKSINFSGLVLDNKYKLGSNSLFFHNFSFKLKHSMKDLLVK